MSTTAIAHDQSISQSSLLPTAVSTSTSKRDVKKVPFVELFGTRLQGVVSSGSDIERVYISYFDVRSLNYGCSTNNNRPCGGLRGSPCNHLHQLMFEAVIQFGLDGVLRFLQIPADPAQLQSRQDIYRFCGHALSEYPADIFSRFLSDLELLDLPLSTLPRMAMAWFTE